MSSLLWTADWVKGDWSRRLSVSYMLKEKDDVFSENRFGMSREWERGIRTSLWTKTSLKCPMVKGGDLWNGGAQSGSSVMEGLSQALTRWPAVGVRLQHTRLLETSAKCSLNFTGYLIIDRVHWSKECVGVCGSIYKYPLQWVSSERWLYSANQGEYGSTIRYSICLHRLLPHCIFQMFFVWSSGPTFLSQPDINLTGFLFLQQKKQTIHATHS